MYRKSLTQVKSGPFSVWNFNYRVFDCKKVKFHSGSDKYLVKALIFTKWGAIPLKKSWEKMIKCWWINQPARPVRSTEIITAVVESVHEPPSTSTCQPSQQLDILRTSLMQILRKDLVMKSYQVQLVHERKPIDHPSRVRLANLAKGRLTEDSKFFLKIIYSDEAHFHCRIWGTSGKRETNALTMSACLVHISV